MNAASFPSLLQRFFADRLRGELGASSNTIAAYRDTFRLLFRFIAAKSKRTPSDIRIEDLDAPFLGRFLDYLERDRNSSVRSRNARLSALRSFFRHVAVSEPALVLQCQRILAMPAKRYQRAPVEFLNEKEATAIVNAPDLGRWIGRRDRMLLLLALQTGLRNSEIRSLRCQDVALGSGAHVRCFGKGRKTRYTPLCAEVVKALKEWLSERGSNPDDPVFPNSRGGQLSADTLQRLVTRHVNSAGRICPSLKGRTITPHALRHTAAMRLLQGGVDLTVIALWLGHESTETTQIYLHADMRLKEKALAYTSTGKVKPARYRPKDAVMAFLESL